MPSSTSSSDRPAGGLRDESLMRHGMPGDDPAAADGPVLRPLPSGRLWLAAAVAALLSMLGLAAWEAHWRLYGVEQGYRNSDDAWAMQRRRIDTGEGDALVIIGSSRALFDIDLDVWQGATNERPIQLSLEGTSPMFALEDLADDPDFRGRLLVDIAPLPFFSNRDTRANVLGRYRHLTPAQRGGYWLSSRLVEPSLVHQDPDFALFTVLARLPWPQRPQVFAPPRVRKLSVMTTPDRNTRMWAKVERDPAYRQLVRGIWLRVLQARVPPSAVAAKVRDEQIARAAAAVDKLRARGVPVVFIRPPSNGPWLEAEERHFPRRDSWDVLLARTGAPGVHYADFPAMQGLDLPEWSHLSAADAKRFTAILAPHVEAAFARARSAGAAVSEPAPAPAGDANDGVRSDRG
jgi:hypothetical protein